MNKRIITSIETTAFGKILYLEVGLPNNIGAIHGTYTPNKPCKRVMKKGNLPSADRPFSCISSGFYPFRPRPARPVAIGIGKSLPHGAADGLRADNFFNYIDHILEILHEKEHNSSSKSTTEIDFPIRAISF